jgi:hypothetical protein
VSENGLPDTGIRAQNLNCVRLRTHVTFCNVVIGKILCVGGREREKGEEYCAHA